MRAVPMRCTVNRSMSSGLRTRDSRSLMSSMLLAKCLRAKGNRIWSAPISKCILAMRSTPEMKRWMS